MAAVINTYNGLSTAFVDWLARSGDSELTGRFDDYVALCERRIYYGYATDDPDNPLRSDPLRIPEMQTVNNAFALTKEVAQPAGFLELISADPNWDDDALIGIVAERVIDAYNASHVTDVQTTGDNTPYVIAVSGTNFRFYPDPGSNSWQATLRYYQKLTTPTPGAANAIITNYPDVYLNGVLAEAAIYTGSLPEAQVYLGMFNASVKGLNARSQRQTASANPQIRVRAGMCP